MIQQQVKLTKSLVLRLKEKKHVLHVKRKHKQMDFKVMIARIVQVTVLQMVTYQQGSLLYQC
ncbi:unnamed protein product [Paramecium pentaurelia]|uniref:Uncharacterized protein n=1 Tax=Paramecium pentaurelia TaxID=43138 RepID=A0A8S1YBF0_9CILI|nr:unnamed protein product [Paramecium pentaurelia]